MNDLLNIEKVKIKKFMDDAFPLLFDATSSVCSMKYYLKENDPLMAISAAHDALELMNKVYDIAEENDIIIQEFMEDDYYQEDQEDKNG